MIKVIITLVEVWLVVVIVVVVVVMVLQVVPIDDGVNGVRDDRVRTCCLLLEVLLAYKA